MTAKIFESSGIARIQLAGDLTADVVLAIENLFSRLGDRGANRILLDLGEVQTMEPQAIPILTRIVVSLRTRGGELRVVNAKGILLEILGHRRMRRFFGLSPTVEEAVNALTRHDPCRETVRYQKALAARLA
jgi:anti-anti-sigma factor